MRVSTAQYIFPFLFLLHASTAFSIAETNEKREVDEPTRSHCRQSLFGRILRATLWCNVFLKMQQNSNPEILEFFNPEKGRWNERKMNGGRHGKR